MKYVTVYTTRDKSEVSVLKSLFESEKLDFKIIEEEVIERSVVPARYFQVADKDREDARNILHQTGYLKIHNPHEDRPAASSSKKWIFFFLAALVLVIVAFIIAWFMNAP